MKKTIFLITIIISAIVISSCKKKKQEEPVGALGPNFPTVVNTVVTPAILDTLKKHGVIIHEGLTPPSVNGIYLLHPLYCIYDNSGDKRAGTLFDDYKYKFTNQDNAAYTIRVDYANTNRSDVGSDVSGTYIAGSGNFFTIFANTKGVSNGIDVNQLEVISGEIQTGSAIKNFQLAHFLISKGPDPTPLLEKVNSTRIFIDQDLSSGIQTTFSVQPQQIQSVSEGRVLPGIH